MYMLLLKMLSYTTFFIILTKKHITQLLKNTKSNWMKKEQKPLRREH